VDREIEHIDTDPAWWNQYRRTQAMYDTRKDDEDKRRPTLALAVAAILIVLIIAYGTWEYLEFFFEVGGSKYD
jgi:hypothetical protein